MPRLKWSKQWNDPSSLLPINGKITVEREDGRAGIFFHHAYQAGIGEGHGDVAIGFHEIKDTRQILSAVKFGNDHLVLQVRSELVTAASVVSKKEKCFRQNGIASEERTPQAGKLPYGPMVMLISPVEHGVEWSCIQDHSRHLPKPFIYFGFVDLSVFPLSKHPSPSFIKS